MSTSINPNQNSQPIFDRDQDFGLGRRKGNGNKNQITPESAKKALETKKAQNEQKQAAQCDKAGNTCDKVSEVHKVVAKGAVYIPIIGPIISGIASLGAAAWKGAGGIAKAAGNSHEKAGKIAEASAKTAEGLDDGRKAVKKATSPESRALAKKAFEEKQVAHKLHGAKIKNAHAEKLADKASKLETINPEKAAKLKDKAEKIGGAAQRTLSAVKDLPEVAPA